MQRSKATIGRTIARIRSVLLRCLLEGIGSDVALPVREVLDTFDVREGDDIEDEAEADAEASTRSND